MKVGIVCPYDWSFPGGVKTHIQGLATALHRKGVETLIAAPASRPEPGIFRMGRAVPVPFNGSVARLCFSFAAKRRLHKLIAREGVDVLHLHEPGIPSLSMLGLIEMRVPAVATFHASSASSRGYQIARPLLAPLLGRIRERIAVSDSAKTLIGRYFPGRYHIIPNGIDAARYADAPPDQAVTSTGPTVLFLGRDEPRKGLGVAIEAVELARRRLDVGLLIAGSHPRALPAWASSVGPVDAARLPGLYRAADVFLAPSLFGESFGIVLAEAMAAGTPVVCSDLPGYMEAGAGACLHFPVGDASAAARMIEDVITQPDLRSDLIRRGQQRASQLDWHRLVDDVVSLYDRAVS